jgi:hypothetical protein
MMLDDSESLDAGPPAPRGRRTGTFTFGALPGRMDEPMGEVPDAAHHRRDSLDAAPYFPAAEEAAPQRRPPAGALPTGSRRSLPQRHDEDEADEKVQYGGDELKQEMREALEATGAIRPLKAQLRAAVFHALRGNTRDTTVPSAGSPASPEMLVVHELFREYLRFAGLKHTLSVFEGEAALSAVAPPRRILAEKVGLPAAPADVPLVFALVTESAGLAAEDA